jgi:hypothetical protein
LQIPRGIGCSLLGLGTYSKGRTGIHQLSASDRKPGLSGHLYTVYREYGI